MRKILAYLQIYEQINILGSIATFCKNKEKKKRDWKIKNKCIFDKF